jgi:hypothetical protein
VTKKVAFLDTMVFLHFRPLDQIDWRTLLGADEVELVLAPVVCRQLDRHKDQSREGLRDRAKKSVAQLKDRLRASGDLRPGVTLKLVHEDPTIDFATHHLTRDVEDDQLVATALEYREATGQPVYLITDDFLLMAAKARAAGIEPVAPPDEARLPDALSEGEKKMRRLEAENQRLQGQRPQLTVRFASGADHEEVELRPLGPLSPDAHKRLLEEERQRHSLKDVGEPSTDSPIGAIARLALSYERPANLEYNHALATYFEKYSSYLKRRHAHREERALSVSFTLRVSNLGTAPATDVDIVVRAGAPVAIFEEDDRRLKAPKVPRPPEEPDHRLAPHLYFDRGAADLIALNPALLATSQPHDPSIRLVQSDEGFEIHAHTRKIKHTQEVGLGPFVVRFASAEAVRPFRMSYSINCQELSENTGGDLHLVAKLAG